MNYYNELYHYGVKGQKWGVRRYQRKDGSLTRLGKKRVDEGAKLFPTYKGKRLKWKSERSFNRDTVVETITNDRGKDERREYDKYVKNHPSFAKKIEKHTRDGYDPSDMRDYWSANLRNKTVADAKKKEYADRFIDEYSNATLKDLDIIITPAAKKYTEDVLRKNNVRI